MKGASGGPKHSGHAVVIRPRLVPQPEGVRPHRRCEHTLVALADGIPPVRPTSPRRPSWPPPRLPTPGELRLAPNDILVGDNVRDIDQEHVENLAQSIALGGPLVPLIVRPTSAGYELVADYQRCHACRRLDLSDAVVVVRDRDGSSGQRGGERPMAAPGTNHDVGAQRPADAWGPWGSGRSPPRSVKRMRVT